jgi:hypothetical protein
MGAEEESDIEKLDASCPSRSLSRAGVYERNGLMESELSKLRRVKSWDSLVILNDHNLYSPPDQGLYHVVSKVGNVDRVRYTAVSPMTKKIADHDGNIIEPSPESKSLVHQTEIMSIKDMQSEPEQVIVQARKFEREIAVINLDEQILSDQESSGNKGKTSRSKWSTKGASASKPVSTVEDLLPPHNKHTERQQRSYMKQIGGGRRDSKEVTVNDSKSVS